MEQFLMYVEKLYTTFGAWALAMIAVTFLVMIPINIGVKALFNLVIEKKLVKNENATTTELERLRKMSSTVIVFIVAIVVLYLFEWIFGSKNYDFSYVLANCFPIGVCSMALWSIVKSIKQVGFEPVITWIASKLETSGHISKLLSAIDIDENVKVEIYKAIETKIKTTDTSKVESYVNTQLSNDVASLLKLYGITTNISTVAKQFYDVLKTKYISTEETK